MKIRMKMVDSYITKYNYEVARRTVSNEKIEIKFNIKCKLLKPEEKENEILTGIDLENEIFLNSSTKGDEMGKITATIRGIFLFDKDIEEKEMQSILRTEGAELVYKQLRTYINASTALSGSAPNINLPNLNFAEKEANGANIESN